MNSICFFKWRLISSDVISTSLLFNLKVFTLDLFDDLLYDEILCFKVAQIFTGQKVKELLC